MSSLTSSWDLIFGTCCWWAGFVGCPEKQKPWQINNIEITGVPLKDHIGVKTTKCVHRDRKIDRYEVSSIKNANPSIKFEGIKLQKCLIACKKGIDVVVRFQYSEIG